MGRAAAKPPGPWPHLASPPGCYGFTGGFIQDIAAAASVAAGQNWAIAAMVAAGQTRPAGVATTPRRRMKAALRLPHTVQLCIRCRRNPAGFWVSRTGGTPARRPWCLSCCQQLDPARYHMTRFDGRDGTRG